VKLPVRARPEVAADIADLPDDELRTIALSIIASLGERPYLGRPLRGNISDCRKIYFDRAGVTEHPAFRVVYRLKPGESQPEEVDVITVGERAGLAAYRQARKRLGRG
jgi:hypothetical protein